MVMMSNRYQITKDMPGKVLAKHGIVERAGDEGISADERAIEVDHIIPRKHGGEDDPTNLQALCFKCNANKGDRDDADLCSTS
jgi:5-methylcytosine-specific restriction endonuclease McrA